MKTMKKYNPLRAGVERGQLLLVWLGVLSVHSCVDLSRRWIVGSVVLAEVLGCCLRVDVEHHSGRVVLGDVR